MPETRTGSDTFVIQEKPKATRGDAKNLIMCGKAGEQQRIFIDQRPTAVRGKVVTLGEHMFRARRPLVAQTITAHLVTGSWRAATQAWTDQPTLGPSVAVAIPATPAGGWITLPIASLLQAIANGTTAVGFRLATNANTPQYLASLESPDKPVLRWSATEDPSIPTALTPSGGSIGRPKWTAGWAGDEDQVALQVQVDPDGTVPIAWDSAEQPLAVPEYDLATSTYPGLAVDAEARWRARTKDADAATWSAWSDWSDPVTYRPKPGIIPDNPAGGVLYDPTSVITSHLSTGLPPVQWEIVLTDAQRKRLWSSEIQSTPDIEAELPAKVRGARLLTGDGDYGILYRILDRSDRVSSAGDPAWTELWVPFVLDSDAGTPPPADYTVTHLEGTPTTRHTWTRPATPDGGWIVWLGDRIVETLTADDVTQVGTSYSWDAIGYAPGWTPCEWRLQAVENKKASVAVAFSMDPVELFGFYLIRDTTGEWVRLEGDRPDWERKDRLDTYTPLNATEPVEIRRAQEGRAGALACGIGALYDDAADFLPSGTVAARVAMVRRFIKEVPHSEPMRIVVNDEAHRVWVRHLDVQAAKEWNPADPVYDVTGQVRQIVEGEGVWTG